VSAQIVAFPSQAERKAEKFSKRAALRLGDIGPFTMEEWREIYLCANSNHVPDMSEAAVALRNRGMDIVEMEAIWLAMRIVKQSKQPT
jgi:hypothetical protein